jgi:predicted nucleic acid-binding protein
MADPLVINTGPLITLARIGALDLPGNLPYAFVCPAQVREELDEGERVGYPRIAPAWLEVLPIKRDLSRLESITLGAGEAAVIELALERGISRVCIDEWKGRRAALLAGLDVVGVLGLLGRAKRLGLIPAIRPYIDRAIREGIHYDAVLLANVLKAVGES